MNEIINAKLFQLQDDASQVRSEDFRIGVVLHFTLVRLFRVQTESFAGASSSSTTSTLLKDKKESKNLKLPEQRLSRWQIQVETRLGFAGCKPSVLQSRDQ